MEADPDASGAAAKPVRQWLRTLLKVRVWLGEVIRPNELQITLFWAGVVGILGALASVGFRKLTAVVHWALTAQTGTGFAESFAHLPSWQRVVTPAVGGALAGLVIHYGSRLTPRQTTTDYMEAIVLGDGVISFRRSMVKSLSALFSVASGGSIGREGPLVQLSSMLASLVGRWQRWSTTRLRLLVACGSAAGIAAAYNAPIAGALFVSEIILGSMAMEIFGPLVFSSVIATLTVRQFIGTGPIYDIPPFRLGSNLEIIPHLFVGLLAGLFAPWFLRLLRGSERLFSRLTWPVYAKMALGGLIVGVLAINYPGVCGNGYSVVNGILHGEWIWQSLVGLLFFKMIATSATFGSGAVGGVFTPTLFVGASLGWLLGALLQHFVSGAPNPSAFALVGMGAFLAATTHAPIMAILMLFETTLDYQIILPLMLACVVAYYTSTSIEKRSIYAGSLARKGAGNFRERLAGMRVANLMKSNPPAVKETARFEEIAQSFIAHRFNFLYVVRETGRFLGVVSLHDVKGFLNQPELAELVIARDVLHEDFPTISPQATLTEALDTFSRHQGERLPVVSDESERRLMGSISKSDLILAVAEQSKQKETIL